MNYISYLPKAPRDKHLLLGPLQQIHLGISIKWLKARAKVFVDLEFLKFYFQFITLLLRRWSNVHLIPLCAFNVLLLWPLC